MMTGPRNIAGGVVRGDDLYGREQAVADLWDAIAKDHLLLLGPRRHGKTSLMFALSDAPATGWSVHYANVMHVEDVEEFLALLTADLLSAAPVRQAFIALARLPAQLAAWLQDLIGEMELDVPDAGAVRVKLRERLRDGPADWRDLGAELVATMARLPTRPLLVIDEFPVMVASMLERDPSSTIRFLRWFQRLRTTTPHVRFLVGGSLRLGPLLELHGEEALLGDLARYELRPFTSELALRFVRDVLHAETGETIDATMGVTICQVVGSGVPYFLQVFIAELLQEARRRRQPVSDLDLVAVFREHVVGPATRTRFSHYVSRLKHYPDRYDLAATRLLHDLARADSVTTRTAAAICSELHVPPEDLVARLEADYYVERDGEHLRFLDGFLKSWWARNAPSGRRS